MNESEEIKNWNVEIEEKITKKWMREENFRFDPKKAKKIYSIDTPPPYVNRPIHIGQAITYCYMDFFARYKRMKGFDVVFPLGLDRNGLPIEMAAEKEYKISAHEVGRKKFLEYCEKLLNSTSSDSIDSFRKLGISFTSYEEGKHIGAIYKTDSKEYRKLTQKTFVDLYKKGVVYESTRINNWDPKLRTTLADSEIEYKDIPSKFTSIKWRIKETGEFIEIATTRPELICTCGMVIFNPKDSRYLHLEGKTAITPLFAQEVKIAKNNLADPEKGTGIVMMCSAGDLSDIQFFRDMNLKPKIAIGQDGRMNENSGFLNGLKVKEAREKILEVLKEKGLITKQENIMHRTPVSERSGAEIEFIEMPEFYMRQLEFKDELRKISKKIDFYPEESRKILDSWFDSIKIDWPISRRRYYATPIPLWHSDDGLVVLPHDGRYCEPWIESPEKNDEVYKDRKKIGKVSDFSGVKWIGEERVFDTWMDSSISELYILGYGEDDSFFKRAYPASLRPQGKEIVRTWLYYTLLRGYLETKKACFKDVWIHQHILDEKGRKMSKSLGNVIDPQEILKSEGAEALRFWSAIEGDLSSQDLMCSRERIKSELKTINKIINVSKFVSLFKSKKSKISLSALDKYFIEYIGYLTFKFESCYDKYDFHTPAVEMREFIWEDFASHYIEVVKSRAYNADKYFSEKENESAKYTLNFVLDRLLLLIYPIIPQVTSVIGETRGMDMKKQVFPKTKKSDFEPKLIKELKEFNSFVWKKKKENGISLRETISGIEVPEGLKIFEKDLKACHNLK